MIVRAFTLFLTVFALLCAAPAFAACTTPDGVASQTRFDFATHKMLYCDGSNWIQIPSSGTGKGCVQDGVVVPSGVSYNFFSAQSHANCASIQQSRLCTDGVLGGTGTFQYALCSTADTTPDAFSFTDQTGVAVNTVTNSNIVQITGITAQATITFTGGGFFRVCGDAACSVNPTWNLTSIGGAIGNGEYLQVRVTSSASYSTAFNLVVNVGGVSDTWTVTTGANLDTTPNAFTFTDVTDSATSTVTPSNIVQISGINTSTPVSATGSAQIRVCTNATCSTNPAWITGTTGTNITNNQYLQVRMTSSASNSTAVTTDVTVGTVTDNWSITTIAPDLCPSQGGISGGANLCWFLGGVSQTCHETCSSNTIHRYYSTQTDSAIQNHISCGAMLTALGAAGSGNSALGGSAGMGCHVNGTSRRLYTPADGSTVAAGGSRVCACTDIPAASSRFFVKLDINGTWDAENTGTNYGKMHDANMECLSRVLSQNWLGKSNAVITRSTVKAWLCDQYSCNNLEPSTSYAFAAAGQPSIGGSTITTNSGKQGPGNSSAWNTSTTFGAATTIVTGRNDNTATYWGNTPSNTCNSWSDYSSGTAGLGVTTSTNAGRWANTSTGSCSGRGSLVCIVNSATDPDCISRGGAQVVNSCWFLGAANQSCTTVCNGLGGGYSAITSQAAGTDGPSPQNINQCTDVLNALNAPGSGNAVDTTGAFGCHVTTANARRISVSSSTTPAAASATVRRACACNF